MGPVRHRQLIRLLAFVVVLDLVVGVAALYTRGAPATAADSKARTSRAGAPDATAGDGTAAGETPAGEKFSKRRASATGSTAPAAGGKTNGSSTPATSAPGSSTSRGSAPGTGSSTASASRGTTSTTAPATTSSTVPAASSSTAPATTPPTTAAAAPAPSRFTWIPLEDNAGDPVVEGTDKRRDEGRADIVRTQAAYTASLIALNVETAQNVDPTRDGKWRSSSTFQAWELDVDGDAKVDFEVQYLFHEEDGTVAAGVSRVGDVETDSVCEAQAQYWPGGYAIGFDPACVGSPAAFSYRAKMYFDTDPANADAEVLTDTAPNGGLSRPVTRQSD